MTIQCSDGATRQNNGTARLTLNIHLGISWRGGSRTKRATICAQVFQLVAVAVARQRQRQWRTWTGLQSGEMTTLSAGLHRPMIMGAMTILITDRANSQRSPMVTVGWHSSLGRGWGTAAAATKPKKKKAHAKEKANEKRTAMRNATRKRRQQKRKLKTAKQGSKK